jgi:copper transport protein
MRRSLTAAALLVLSFGLAAAGPRPVAAHALLVSADPARNASVPAAPTTITLTFTEPPDPAISTIQVLDSSGHPHGNPHPTVVAGQPTELQVHPGPLSDGVYTVAWKTVSKVDGHLVLGSFAFSVGVPLPAGAGAGSGAGSVASTSEPFTETLAHWLLFLGLIAMVGAAFVGGVLAQAPAPAILRLILAGGLLGGVGTVALVAVQALAAGVAIGDLAGSSLGSSLVLRSVPLLATALIAGLVLKLRRSARGAVLVAFAGGLAAMLADAALSHASGGPLPVFNVVVQWLHVGAVGTWIGGIGGLLVQTRGEPSEVHGRTARRFALSAGVGLGLVVVTGLIRAAFELGQLDQLWLSDFGRLLLVKGVLLAVLAVLGALNHFRHVPMFAVAPGRLRITGTAELVIATALLLAAAQLVNLAPPVEILASQAVAHPTITLRGHDAGTSMRLKLVVSPGTVGSNAFSATVVDYDTGAPVDVSKVVLTFSLPANPGIGASDLTLTKQGNGDYTGSGTNLSIAGSWSVSALVDAGLASVVVPLAITVRQPPQVVDVNRTPGEPTIYTVHLTEGRTVQVYLDPDKPNVSNDFHATFFDAAGNELPASGITIAVTPSGGTSRSLTTRILEPGHVVTTLDPGKGPDTFVVTGTAPAGGTLRAELTITPGS